MSVRLLRGVLAFTAFIAVTVALEHPTIGVPALVGASALGGAVVYHRWKRA